MAGASSTVTILAGESTGLFGATPGLDAVGTHHNHQADASLTLKLRRKPARKRRVSFADGTVDNEDLARKKSKCCCIYHKPRAFDESSSDDADDTPCDQPPSAARRAKPAGASASDSTAAAAHPPTGASGARG